jgi:hypothetical protein
MKTGFLGYLNDIAEKMADVAKAIGEVEAAQNKANNGGQIQKGVFQTFLEGIIEDSNTETGRPELIAGAAKGILSMFYQSDKEIAKQNETRQAVQEDKDKKERAAVKKKVKPVKPPRLDITDKARSKYIKMAEGVLKILSKEAPMQGAGLDQTVGEVKKAKGISQRVMGSNDIKTDALLNRGGNASTVQKVSQTIGQKTNTLLKKNNELLQELVIKPTGNDLKFPSNSGIQ